MKIEITEIQDHLQKRLKLVDPETKEYALGQLDELEAVNAFLAINILRSSIPTDKEVVEEPTHFSLIIGITLIIIAVVGMIVFRPVGLASVLIPITIMSGFIIAFFKPFDRIFVDI